MRIVYGDLFTCPHDNDAICVTTNGIVRTYNSTAVMGAGIAKTFATKFPKLPKILGKKLIKYGNHAFYLDRVLNYGEEYYILSFPTKEHYRDKSSIDLITKSCYELIDIVDEYDIDNCYFPLPGCGLGGLRKDEVLPIISKILDNRFVLVLPRR